MLPILIIMNIKYHVFSLHTLPRTRRVYLQFVMIYNFASKASSLVVTEYPNRTVVGQWESVERYVLKTRKEALQSCLYRSIAEYSHR